MDHSRDDRFQQIYDKNYDDLWMYCLRRSANESEAEEVLGDTFTVAWQKLDEIPVESERPWLYGVAHNHLRNSWRKGKRRTMLRQRLKGERSTTGLDPADVALGDGRNVLLALTQLKPKDQEILRLSTWEDLSISEIAIALDCTENAASIKLHRARKSLENKLANRKSERMKTSKQVVGNSATIKGGQNG